MRVRNRLSASAALRTGTRRVAVIASMSMIAAAFTLGSAPAASAETLAPINFEPPTYQLGEINGQDGWTKTGPYDVAVVANTYGYGSFDTQSLRVSNAVTSGSFGDQTFSKSLANEAGETTAENSTYSGGSRQSHFDASFDFASTMATEQVGMSMSVSPDRGDGARMSYLRFVDTSAGIQIHFTAVALNGNFSDEIIATLSRSPHNIAFSMDLIDGPNNDVVKILIDGALVKTGGSWENYYYFGTESPPSGISRTVDSLQFRTGGTAVPGNVGAGYLFDNVNLSSSMTATLGPCAVAVTGSNPTTYTLLADCITDHTVVVPQNAGGSVFDGNGHSITGVDPTGGHFVGAVVQAQAGSDLITVENLRVTVSGLADVCDADANRLRGILFDSVGGTITNDTVTNIEQGASGLSGCQEGNGIEARNAPFAKGYPKLNVTISDNTVTDYQKTGILVNGSVATMLSHNVVTGDRHISYIAQNGVQIGYGATALLTQNDVSQNYYDPSGVTACGLLLYKAGGVGSATGNGLSYVKADNYFHDNEKNICNFGKGGSFSPTS